MSGAVGVVLAGGAGSRLGGAKAGALLAGRPLLSYPVGVLQAVVPRVAVVAKRDSDLPAVGAGVEIVREPDAPRHPMTGVVAALRWAAGAPVVVLACDLPFVTRGLVRALLTVDAGGAPALVARGPDGIQPLCARYEPQALAVLEEFDPAGRLVTQVQALAPAVLDVDPALLRNVNDAGDLAAAEAALTAG